MTLKMAQITHARQREKHDTIPILSVLRVCSFKILLIGKAMMIRSPTAFVVIRDWIIGVYAPQVPWAVHCAETGLQRNMQAERYPTHHKNTTPSKAYEALFIKVAGKIRRKKKSMLALTAARRVT